jgi:hypothetical protein
MNTRTKKTTWQRKIFNKKVLWSLVVLIFASSAAYGLLINQIIWNVVARQKAETNISNMSSQVSSLETSYMTLTDGITIDKAYALGFKDIPNNSIQYVNKDASGPVLSMRTGE